MAGADHDTRNWEPKMTKWRETKKFAFYGRVSTDEQARDAYGLESQLASCREYVDSIGGTIVALFEDPGLSGWKGVERPGFRRMMAYVTEHKDVNLVFYDYSRFGRGTEKGLRAFGQLDKMGVVSVAADNPGIDCRTASGRTSRREELSRAEDFSDKNSEKTSARMKLAFDEGRYCRPALYGYKNTGSKVKGQPNIVPDEATAPFVRKAFEMVAAGDDRPADILRTLTQMGMTSKAGKPMTLHTFLKMLRNPTYMGMLQSNKFREIKQGQHTALVDERTFRNAQLVLKGKTSLAPITWRL